jgi:cation transport ATPase
VDGQLAGALEVADEIRPEAKGTVARLLQMGMQVSEWGSEGVSEWALEVADEIRPEAKGTVARLLQMGMQVSEWVSEGVREW